MNMLVKLLGVVAVLLVLLSAWVLVQAAARRVAARHPEAGPYREAGGGCSGGCGGCSKACDSAGREDSAHPR
jgi:hypothetical protein